jgi:hypothetical protein
MLVTLKGGRATQAKELDALLHQELAILLTPR